MNFQKNISVRNYIRNLHCHYTKSIDPSGAQTIYGNIIINRVKKESNYNFSVAISMILDIIILPEAPTPLIEVSNGGTFF